MNERITERHLGKKAILYVRQSTPRQTLENLESQKLQYAMRSELEKLGWKDIEVIDEDLGRSASGVVDRRGFDRMLAEVGLGNIGIVAARELSRFARNSREWQQLIEICRVVDVLLLDHEAVYDSRRSNDRLLLGLKGSLNEYELDLLRVRAHEAKNEKARRGEYYGRLPVGYVRADDGGLTKHPDRQVRQTLELAFSKVLELGSVRQAVLWFARNEVPFPLSETNTVIVWKRPGFSGFKKLVTNPTYAGAYAYGKTERLRRVLPNGSLQQVLVEREPTTLIRDHHEAYVSWGNFERIAKMIDDNAQKYWAGVSPGAPKKGAALLAGMIRCGGCGRKAMVRQAGGGRDIPVYRYACNRDRSLPEDQCVSFNARALDDLVVGELLRVVQPAAIEAAVRATEAAVQSQTDLQGALTNELEAARYQASRAQKQFDAVDPENRLVADELERRWNASLEKVGALEKRLREKREAAQNRPIPSLDAFRELSADLAIVWHAPATDPRLKKRIIRTLIEELVVVTGDERSDLEVVIHWKGGIHTEHRIKKRARGTRAGPFIPTAVIDAVRLLLLVCNDSQIAGWLHRAGLSTPTGKAWNSDHVTGLRRNHGLKRHSPNPEWLTKKQAAALIGVAELTLQRAVERGEIDALRPLPNGPWIFKRADLEALHLKRGRAPKSKQLTLKIPPT